MCGSGWICFCRNSLREAGKKLPVLVFIHGGAWQAGSKEQGRGQVMRFVTEGKCAGVSVGYRLSQEAQWPAQIHDCKAALRWIKAHADEHGLDAGPHRGVGLVGGRASGGGAGHERRRARRWTGSWALTRTKTRRWPG